MALLSIRHQREYVLSREELARLQQDGTRRGDLAPANAIYFAEDLRTGQLKGLEGTFVAYHRGTICGQSVNGELLYQEATALHGEISLAVFPVPDIKTPVCGNMFSSSTPTLDDALAKAFKEAKGQFK